ncbi:MAG TPA: DUF4214 domain-containing protein [Vicinamibacteria bacterium]|nr:DUF4214 domain-containing protein [Vicinamibacteria bacterium]
MRLTTATLVAIAFGSAAGGFVPGGTNVHLALDLNGVALAQDDESADRAIERAFRAVLDREPSSTERRRYRLLMRENEWGEVDVRRDLSERPDYRRFSKERGVEPEAVIRKAYQDILGRDPDSEGVRTYRSKMIDEGWSEREVREALRRSEEHASSEHRYASADRIIRRAYQDILGREPDPEGQQTFRRHIVEDGFDEHDVREALRRSPERRQRSDAEAAAMVRRAYRAVLDREPDPTGLRDYKARVLRDHWSEQQIVDDLRQSDEYRRKRR